MNKSFNFLTSISKLSLISLISVSMILPAVSSTVPKTNQAESLLLAQTSTKQRVAILDFDFSTISDPSLLTLFPGIAKGTSDMLVNSLVNTGAYSVIERSQIDAILAEQNLGASGLVDVSTAAKIGKILGVKYIILGSVTQFDVQERKSGFSIGGLVGNKKRKVTADVQLNVRMIDTTTAEIVGAFEGKGSTDQKDASTAVLGVSSGSDTDNRQQLLTEATRIAIKEVTTQVSEFAKK
jgi:curli biogenesis system outer membrane secretion channel CsgG